MPPSDEPVLKHTLEFDEMSVLLSPDQIKWMKAKQEQKYYFCHFFMHYRNWVSRGDFSRQIPMPAQCHPLICQPADKESFHARKGMPPESKDQGSTCAVPVFAFRRNLCFHCRHDAHTGQAWLKNKVGFSARKDNHLYQGTIPNLRHLNATETQSPIWHSVRVTGYTRRSREILRAGMGKNNRMVAIQRDPGCCMGQWQREESWTTWILPVRVPRATLASRLGRFAGEWAQADLGSAEIEGKEKKERSISNKFQGLASSQPVF